MVFEQQKPDIRTPEYLTPDFDITFEEYLTRFDGKHAEWLMGKVLVHMANNETHQNLMVFLINLLSLYLNLKSFGRLMIAPFSMYISDEQPAREPDLMVILGERTALIQHTFMNGAADIAIEIVSPESVARDYGDKFKEYETARVPEYWIFDPERRTSDIYVLQDNGRYRRNPLDAQGHIWSTLLPGFALDPALLWAEPLPAGVDVLRLAAQMTGARLSIEQNN